MDDVEKLTENQLDEMPPGVARLTWPPLQTESMLTYYQRMLPSVLPGCDCETGIGDVVTQYYDSQNMNYKR
jgi:hypothetical protein